MTKQDSQTFNIYFKTSNMVHVLLCQCMLFIGTTGCCSCLLFIGTKGCCIACSKLELQGVVVSFYRSCTVVSCSFWELQGGVVACFL